ncbi:MAG TPA: hypothetical protein VFV05_17285 [Methylomirabilota bacterium]|nr:hypothetical protein [Methylomirabilota bacterium]
MARVLHLLKAGDPLALSLAGEQQAAGDDVTLVMLPGAPDFTPPPGVTRCRVPDELSWEALLERIFESDQVITW